MLLASFDVEWTKNYRIKNGNRPFCFSVVYLPIPTRGQPVDLAGCPWWWSSTYVESSGETADLVEVADVQLGVASDAGARLVGHQLSSDLAILLATAGREAPRVESARDAWGARRATGRVLDTRYDAGHLLDGCASRRLVDVCTALRLDVTQPELHRTSMTALHRAWLETGDTLLRERISVLNLRHSLSTALVAALATGAAQPGGAVNVNRLLAAGLGDQFDYLRSPMFTALL